MALRHVLSASDFTREELAEMFTEARHRRDTKISFSKEGQGRTLVTLFYEPSTRTRLSFEAAAARLRMNVLSTENAAQFSSAVKGESLEDTMRVVGGFGEIIVLRHPEVGSAAKAAAVSSVPIINGGDGTGEHPTQSLADLFTLMDTHRRAFASLLTGTSGGDEPFTIAFIGDIENGRTVHSLVRLLMLFPNVSFRFVSPLVKSWDGAKQRFPLPPALMKSLTDAGRNAAYAESIDDVLPAADAYYVTRIQKERMDKDEYASVRGSYLLTPAQVAKMKPDAVILHPLPRNDELPTEIDADPRAKYFQQAHNGLHVRTALLKWMLKG